MRERQDPERMKTWLSRREHHGWSWAELSRRSGLPVWKLRWWRRRFDRTAEPLARASDAFVAVDVVTLPSATPIEVVMRSGHRLSVPAGFDEAHVVRLLRVLQAFEAGC
jgi:hypothetical protein